MLRRVSLPQAHFTKVVGSKEAVSSPGLSSVGLRGIVGDVVSSCTTVFSAHAKAGGKGRLHCRFKRSFACM